MRAVLLTRDITPLRLEATSDPLCDDRLEFGRSFLPDAVSGLENVQAGMGQSFAQKLCVPGEAVGIVPSDNDCDGNFD